MADAATLEKPAAETATKMKAAVTSAKPRTMSRAGATSSNT